MDHPVETAARPHLRTEQNGEGGETTDKKQMRVHDAFGIVVGNFLVLTRLDRCTPIGSPVGITIKARSSCLLGVSEHGCNEVSKVGGGNEIYWEAMRKVTARPSSRVERI